jgi:hypothetical protein
MNLLSLEAFRAGTQVQEPGNPTRLVRCSRELIGDAKAVRDHRTPGRWREGSRAGYAQCGVLAMTCFTPDGSREN